LFLLTYLRAAGDDNGSRIVARLRGSPMGMIPTISSNPPPRIVRIRGDAATLQTGEGDGQTMNRTLGPPQYCDNLSSSCSGPDNTRLHTIIRCSWLRGHHHEIPTVQLFHGPGVLCRTDNGSRCCADTPRSRRGDRHRGPGYAYVDNRQ